MIIFAYMWIIGLLLKTLFIVVAVIVEKNFDESHPIMKWWRRNVIGPDPQDKTPYND
jgi:hypothetical protein